MSTQQAAEQYGLHVETIRRWIRTGVLRAQKIGPVYIIDERDLRRVIASPPRPGRPQKEQSR